MSETTELQKQKLFNEELTRLQKLKQLYLIEFENVEKETNEFRQKYINDVTSKIAKIDTKITELGDYRGQCLHRYSYSISTQEKYYYDENDRTKWRYARTDCCYTCGLRNCNNRIY